ncbi:DUF2059 domain-containing protein [Devosia rhodophyticola]|uniref:DUF2059 domain-containing protein n=1 Tax=Devosia rhodophyticola TaxID=3026423 RepID=A0ABY7YZN6_9HYPH|nr:DUF2059 domain-containing protein [Devosia rhodophyticola]WDR06354.1 DUF2059 domain-containing protein [Devosia rhodophyticola]
MMTSAVKRLRAVTAIVLSLSMLALAAPTMAQEVAPDHLALAREYVDLTDRAAIYETTLVETAIQTSRQILSQSPDLADVTNKAIEKVLGEYKSRKGELLDQFARIYALRFSIEELQEIVAFYSSPTGEKLAKANFEVNSDMQQVLQVFTNNLNREFFAKVRAELKADGVDL